MRAARSQRVISFCIIFPQYKLQKPYTQKLGKRYNCHSTWKLNLQSVTRRTGELCAGWWWY